MLFPHRIKEERGEARCALRRTSVGYGFCQGGFRGCAECPRAKLDRRSPERIEPGDMVQTINSDLCTVECFDERHGFRTGFVWLRTKAHGLVRQSISAVMLYRKQDASRGAL